jgi:hypothetical protein
MFGQPPGIEVGVKQRALYWNNGDARSEFNCLEMLRRDQNTVYHVG